MWIRHSIFYSFTFTLTSTLYQAYAIRVLGVDVNDLGNIVFIGLAAIALGNIVAVPLLHRYRHMRIFIWRISTTINAISWALVGFSDMFVHRLYSLILLLAIAQFTGALGGLAYSDTIADIIPKEKSIKIFSQVNVYTVVASFLSLVVSLFVFVYVGTTVIGYRICYTLTLLTAVVSSAFLWMVKDYTKRPNQSVTARYMFIMYRKLLLDNSCGQYLTAIVLFTFFVNLPAALWNYYIIHVFSGNELWISLNTIASTFATALGNYILNAVSHRLNPKKTLSYSVLLTSFVPVMFILSPTLERQILTNIYSGLSWAGFNLMINIYNLYLAGENRVYLISLLGVLSNLSASIASRAGSTIAVIGLTAMQLVFIASALGRLATFFYIMRKVSDI